MKSKARIFYDKHPDLFMEMFAHSIKEDPEHPDDIGVIYSKLMTNASGIPEPYWTPAGFDMAAIYEELLNEPCEACKIEA